MKKLSERQIQVGKPVPFDCYDGQGNLLFKKGLIVDSQRQVEFLLERGLFGKTEATSDEGSKGDSYNDKPPTPFELIGDYYNRLSRCLGAHEGETESHTAAADVLTRIGNLALKLQQLCRMDSDAVLGAIHLYHAGRYSVMHPLYRALVCELVATRGAMEESERLQLISAALTADISMTRLQDELSRQKDALQPQQKAQIACHPQESVRMLTELGVTSKSWILAVLQHHEALDGSGYPQHLSKEALTASARILRLADLYTAQITPQAYRSTATSKLAMREIYLRRGAEVDESLALFLIKELGVFPPGAFVRLQSGELAVITRRTDNPKAPAAMAVVGPRGAPYERPIPRKTEWPEYEIRDVVERDRIVNVNMNTLWGYVA